LGKTVFQQTPHLSVRENTPQADERNLSIYRFFFFAQTGIHTTVVSLANSVVSGSRANISVLITNFLSLGYSKHPKHDRTARILSTWIALYTCCLDMPIISATEFSVLTKGNACVTFGLGQ
jgi:hypothetical protein